MTPPPDKKKQRSLLLGLGCAVALFFLVLLVIGVAMYWMVRQPSEAERARIATPRVPVAWRDSVRSMKDVPAEARRLALPRSDSGNAAPLVYLTSGIGRSGTVARLTRGIPLSAEDSGMVRGAERDTALDRAVRAARRREYRVVPLLLADTTREMRMFWVRLPGVYGGRTGFVLDGLILRGHARLRRGERGAGITDLRAAIGLGLMLYEREPSITGANRGLRVVQQAATLLARAAGPRDAALARDAELAAAWADHGDRVLMFAAFSMFAEPDTALAVVVDTTLPFPVRAEALYLGSLATMRQNPWTAFRGPTGAVWRRAKAYEQHHDPDFAALGLALDTALTRIERVGRWRRLRLFLRGL